MSLFEENQRGSYLRSNGDGPMYVSNMNGTNTQQIYGAWGLDPSFSPDGKKIVFVSTDRTVLWLLDVTTGWFYKAPIQVSTGVFMGTPTISYDNKILLETWGGTPYKFEIWTITFDYMTKTWPQSLRKVLDYAFDPCISPDGAWYVCAAYGNQFGDGLIHHGILTGQLEGTVISWMTHSNWGISTSMTEFDQPSISHNGLRVAFRCSTRFMGSPLVPSQWTASDIRWGDVENHTVTGEIQRRFKNITPPLGLGNGAANSCVKQPSFCVGGDTLVWDFAGDTNMTDPSWASCGTWISSIWSYNSAYRTYEHQQGVAIIPPSSYPPQNYIAYSVAPRRQRWVK